MNCCRPDRNEPKLRCGYTLPCPYHTAILDVSKRRTLLIDDLTTKTARFLIAFGRLLRSKL